MSLQKKHLGAVPAHGRTCCCRALAGACAPIAPAQRFMAMIVGVLCLWKCSIGCPGYQVVLFTLSEEVPGRLVCLSLQTFSCITIHDQRYRALSDSVWVAFVPMAGLTTACAQHSVQLSTTSCSNLISPVYQVVHVQPDNTLPFCTCTAAAVKLLARFTSSRRRLLSNQQGKLLHKQTARVMSCTRP